MVKELNISSTPIREALQQLYSEGFVENISGKGFFVSRILVLDIKELFEIREFLEIPVTKRVALTVDLDKLKILRKKFVSGGTKGQSPNAKYKTGDEIHIFIFKSANNQRLATIFNKLHEHISRIRNHFSYIYNDQNHSNQSFNEHLEIIDALISRDETRAECAMRNHLKSAFNRMGGVIT